MLKIWKGRCLAVGRLRSSASSHELLHKGEQYSDDDSSLNRLSCPLSSLDLFIVQCRPTKDNEEDWDRKVVGHVDGRCTEKMESKTE